MKKLMLKKATRHAERARYAQNKLREKSYVAYLK